MRIVLIFSIFVLLNGCGNSSSSSTEEFVIDKSLPLEERIMLVDLEGKRFDLKTLKGKTVFLNFWATWCKPCIKEMPSIDRARNILADDNFVFLAASDEKIEKIKKFRERYDFGFEIVQVQGDIFDLDIRALPTTFIINEEGKIVLNEVGAREWDQDANIDLISSKVP